MADDAAPRNVSATDLGRSESGEKRTLFTEAFYLALATATAYASAYSYEAGICAAFGLPVELIELETGLLVRAAAAVGITAVAIGIFVFGAVHVTRFPPDTESTLRRPRLILFATHLVTVVVSSGIAWLFYRNAFLPFVVSGVASLTLMGAALVVQKRWPDLVRPKVSLPTLALVCALGLVATGFFAGGGAASTQKDFYVMAGNPEILVVRIYGERALGFPFRRKPLALSRELRIRTIGPETRMRLERIR